MREIIKKKRLFRVIYAAELKEMRFDKQCRMNLEFQAHHFNLTSPGIIVYGFLSRQMT